MRYFSFFFLVCFSSMAFGSDFQIRISGRFPGAEGQLVRLMEYNDLISFREKEVAAAQVDEQGHFSFTFSRFQPRFMFFRIDHARMGFFVEPGKDYFFEFDPVAFFQLDDSRNPYLDPWYFRFNLSGTGAELNHQIDAFEDMLNEFVLENFRLIHSGRNRNLLLEFRQQTDSIFGEIDNEFFREYYEYKYAYYNRIGSVERIPDQMRRYVLNRPVLYHNTQYMNFFHVAFDQYLVSGSRSITIWDLRHTINELNSYHALMDSLGKDTLLRNEVIRELVMLKGLQDLHSNPDYRRSHVEDILSYVAYNSKFPEHRTIAENILFTKRHLAPGQPAPSFSSKNQQGELLNIPEDFNGKFVFIGFWATWCETCLLEFAALQPIYQKHKDDFVFIHISTDRHRNRYEAFVAAGAVPGIHLHYNGDFRMLDAYRIRSMPTYVILDEHGRVLDYPARRPSDGLMVFFDWLIFQKQRQSRP